MERVGAPARNGGAAVGATAFELRGRADTLAEEIAERIARERVELTYDGGLVASCRANLQLGFGMLQDGVPGERALPPPEARLYARQIAHRVGEPDALLAAYRVGCAMFWRAWSAAISERLGEPEDLLTAFEGSTAFMLGYHASLSRQIEQEFTLERGRRPARPLTTRAAMIEALLAGPVEGAESAARLLRYPLGGYHVGVAVQIEADPSEGQDPARIIGELGSCVGAAVLTTSEEGVKAAWLGARDPLDVERVAERARQLAHGASVRIGLGELGHGLEGFRRTHVEAHEALRVAVLGGRPRAATRYAGISLTSLLSVDDQRARRFVEQTLGDLAASDDAASRLRATLRILFEEGLSQTRAARRLGLHHNTIAYRIRRAEDLLGRSIGERRLELEAALTLADAFGERAPAR